MSVTTVEFHCFVLIKSVYTRCYIPTPSQYLLEECDSLKDKTAYVFPNERVMAKMSSVVGVVWPSFWAIRSTVSGVLNLLLEPSGTPWPNNTLEVKRVLICANTLGKCGRRIERYSERMARGVPDGRDLHPTHFAGRSNVTVWSRSTVIIHLGAAGIRK